MPFRIILGHSFKDDGILHFESQHVDSIRGNYCVVSPFSELKQDQPVACAKYIREYIAESRRRNSRFGKRPLNDWASGVLLGEGIGTGTGTRTRSSTNNSNSNSNSKRKRKQLQCSTTTTKTKTSTSTSTSTSTETMSPCKHKRHCRSLSNSPRRQLPKSIKMGKTTTIGGSSTATNININANANANENINNNENINENINDNENISASEKINNNENMNSNKDLTTTTTTTPLEGHTNTKTIANANTDDEGLDSCFLMILEQGYFVQDFWI